MRNLFIVICLVGAGVAGYKKLAGPAQGEGGASVAQSAAPGSGDLMPVLLMSRDASESLAQITPSRVVLFATAWCPHCKTVRALLQKQGVRFTELDVERDERASSFQKEKMPVVGFPVTVIGSRIVIGADEGQILSALKFL